MTPAEDVQRLRPVDIDEAYVPRRRSDVAFIEIDGEVVVTAPIEGTEDRSFDSHWLDPRATVVWNCLDGSTALGELVDDLSDGFGAEREVVLADVLALVRALGRSGLLEGVEAERVEPRPPGPPVGAPVGTSLPPFRAVDLGGREWSDEDLRGERILLVNWSPGCAFCTQMAHELALVGAELEQRGDRLVLVASGSIEDNQQILRESGLTATVLRNEGFEPFEALGTPVAYLIDEGWRVGSNLALGAVEVMDLARRAAGLDDGG